MENFEILPGLPPYGTPALSFPTDGYHSYSEGLVVRFNPKHRDIWIGNFQRGLNSFDRVLPHPDKVHVIVIAGGDGYIVDPETCTMTSTLSSWVTRVMELPDLESVIFGNDLEFWAIGADGELWKTLRISWDGIRNITRADYKLSGEAWSAVDDTWQPFAVDLRSGTVETAIYQQDIKRAVSIGPLIQTKWSRWMNLLRRALAPR